MDKRRSRSRGKIANLSIDTRDKVSGNTAKRRPMHECKEKEEGRRVRHARKSRTWPAGDVADITDEREVNRESSPREQQTGHTGRVHERWARYHVPDSTRGHHGGLGRGW